MPRTHSRGISIRVFSQAGIILWTVKSNGGGGMKRGVNDGD